MLGLAGDKVCSAALYSGQGCASPHDCAPGDEVRSSVTWITSGSPLDPV